MKTNKASIFLWTSILIYVVSLIVQNGWRLLVLGAELLFHYHLWFWLANPLLIFSWIFFRKVWLSLIFSLLAIMLCLYFFFSLSASDRKGTEIVSVIWLLSMTVMLAGNVIRFIQSHKAAANRK